MYYLFLAFPLLIYFELLGRLFFFYIKKEKLEFNFIIGFCLLIAFLYLVGWPISVYGLASIYYVILVSLFIIVSIILIVKNFKKIDMKINIKLWILFVIFLLIAIYISYNRTLGEPHGFDALFYINYIGYNVDTPMLNGVNPLFGTFPNTYYDKTITYAFQSYNYFVPAFIYIVKKIGSLVGLVIETLPTYVWTFQIILSSFFIGSSIEVIRHINSKSKLFNIASFILLVLFMGNFYHNNCFGFIGCNYRMPIHTISTIYLFDYLKNRDKKDLLIFMLLMISMCGFSSTGTFAFIFILFALFFVLIDSEDNLLKYYSIALLIPIFNILVIQFNSSIITLVLSVVICGIAYIINNPLTKLFRIHKIKILSVICISVALILISQILYTRDISPVHFFFENYSEYADMSWDYFDFKDLRHWIFNLIVLIPMIIYIFKNKRKNISMIIIILVLTVFNPLSANFMNTINWVYYRTYDLIINQYTIIYFLYYIYTIVKQKTIYNWILLSLSCCLAIIQIPRYYHYQFKPSDDYNPIYKIEQKELDLIWNIKNLIKEYNIKNPKIINPTFYMNTFIDNSSYLIGKEKNDWHYHDNDTINLYKIVFPEDGYENFKPADEPDYDNLTTYLNNLDYDIFIVDYEKYITYKGEYQSLSKVLESEGYIKNDKYSTLNYAVFVLN